MVYLMPNHTWQNGFSDPRPPSCVSCLKFSPPRGNDSLSKSISECSRIKAKGIAIRKTCTSMDMVKSLYAGHHVWQRAMDAGGQGHCFLEAKQNVKIRLTMGLRQVCRKNLFTGHQWLWWLAYLAMQSFEQ